MSGEKLETKSPQLGDIIRELKKNCANAKEGFGNKVRVFVEDFNKVDNLEMDLGLMDEISAMDLIEIETTIEQAGIQENFKDQVGRMTTIGKCISLIPKIAQPEEQAMLEENFVESDGWKLDDCKKASDKKVHFLDKDVIQGDFLEDKEGFDKKFGDLMPAKPNESGILNLAAKHRDSGASGLGFGAVERPWGAVHQIMDDNQIDPTTIVLRTDGNLRDELIGDMLGEPKQLAMKVKINNGLAQDSQAKKTTPSNTKKQILEPLDTSKIFEPYSVAPAKPPDGPAQATEDKKKDIRKIALKRAPKTSLTKSLKNPPNEVISISPESKKKSSSASPEKKKSKKGEFQISNDNSPLRVLTDQPNSNFSPALKKKKITNDGSIEEKPCTPVVPIKGKLEDCENACDATNANNSSYLGKRQKFSTNASDEKIEFEEDWDLLSHLLEQNDPTKYPKETPFPDPTKAHFPKGFEKKVSIPKAPP